MSSGRWGKEVEKDSATVLVERELGGEGGDVLVLHQDGSWCIRLELTETNALPMSFVSLGRSAEDYQPMTPGAYSTQSNAVNRTICASPSFAIAPMCFRSCCKICLRSCCVEVSPMTAPEWKDKPSRSRVQSVPARRPTRPWYAQCREDFPAH